MTSLISKTVTVIGVMMEVKNILRLKYIFDDPVLGSILERYCCEFCKVYCALMSHLVPH